MTASFGLPAEPRPKVRIIRSADGEWPVLLDEIPDPPTELHVIGRRFESDAACVAIVGTRRPTIAGREIAREIATRVAQAGFVVVSGLAVGVDAIAHRAALDAGGSTIAVLGCGPEVDYPQRNRELRSAIESEGTVISEYPGSSPPVAHNFPARNRIIAGITVATLVIEGGARSGALITARRALDANRSVFAVPGSIRNPMAAGPNHLIKTAQASLLTSVDDLFADLAPGLVWDGPVDTAAPIAPALDPQEEGVIALLGDSPALPQTVADALEMEPGGIALVLARLEVRGLIVRDGCGYALTSAGRRAGTSASSAGGGPGDD